jgi:hypothetical protein
MGFDDLALVSPRDPKVLQRQKVIQRNDIRDETACSFVTSDVLSNL